MRILLAFLLAIPATGSVLSETWQSGQSQQNPQQEQEKKEEKKQEGQQASSQQSASKPSLVEIAKRTREQRDKTERPVLIYTNAVIEKSEGGRVGKTQAPPPPADPQAGEGEAAEGQEEGGQEDPEAVLNQLRTDIQSARLNYVTAVNQHQVVQLSINELRNRYLRESNVAAQQKWQADLAAKAQELSELERSIQSARAALDELRSQARSAGMEPGELRNLMGELPEPKRIVDQ